MPNEKASSARGCLSGFVKRTVGESLSSGSEAPPTVRASVPLMERRYGHGHDSRRRRMINGRPSNGLRLNIVDCGHSLRPSRTPRLMAGIPHALLGVGFEGEVPMNDRDVPLPTGILGARRRANGRVVTNCRQGAESHQARETWRSIHKKGGASLRRLHRRYLRLFKFRRCDGARL